MRGIEKGNVSKMTYTRIGKRIPLPPEILDAVNNEKLVVFIGAGVSRLVGCKGWDRLGQNLINRCFMTKKGDGSSCINFKEKETISQYRGHKKIITICYFILKHDGFENIFFEELEKSLGADPELVKPPNIYDELYGLRGIFVTTNADKHFDRKFNPSQILYKIEDFNPSIIDRTKLYHIHGSIVDRDSLVFTVPQYIKRYNNPQFRRFLEAILNSKEYVVLFVGYGMEEFELIDFLVTKLDSNKDKELKHFILRPFYKGEESILEFEEFYYNSMGIRVLPYEKDEKGYYQLYEIIKDWNSEISQVSGYLYDSYQRIDDAVESFEEGKVNVILQIIRNDKPQEDYFFRKLAKCSDPFPWLRILAGKGYFDGKNNPPPQEVPGREGYFTIPFWNVLGYLENIASQNAKLPSDEITEILLDIVDSIVGYRDESGNRVDNYQTDWVIAEIISSFPLEKIRTDHIEFMRLSLKSRWDNTLTASEIGETVLPYFINNQARELLLQLMDVILDFQKSDRRVSGEYDSIMEEFWLEEAIRKNKSGIARLCSVEAADVALKKILAIVGEDKTQFNIIWVPTVEDHPQSAHSEGYECQLVHFIRDMFEFSEPSRIKTKIEGLLEQKHPIFKRIALHTINYHYNDLNGLFWNWKENPLEEDQTKHELYELLRTKCPSFTRNQIRTVLTWIESKDYYVSSRIENDEENREKVIAYQKKEWLSALLDTANPCVISLYKRYEEINPSEIIHPGFDYWIEGGYGSKSPVEEAELLSRSNEEIGEFLMTYKENGGWDKLFFGELSDCLWRCVSENPQKFADEMDPFLKIQRVYQYGLIRGLSKAWREGKDFAWKGVLNFISQITESNGFWNDNHEKGGKNYRNDIIYEIADLIENGTREDKHAFEAELLPEAEKILLILVEKAESSLFRTEDPITSAWNSPKGKVFSAMINYSLRYARLFRRDQKERWVRSVKEVFNRRLDREAEPSLEFSVMLGAHLAYIIYLDEGWVKNNVNQIFPKENVEHWRAAFSGYLFQAVSVHTRIYSLLKENNHYAEALRTDFKDIHLKERLVQHICIGYLENWEELDDEESLICKSIRSGDFDHLSAIIDFFWMQRSKLTDKIRAKIVPLWGALIDFLSQKEGNSKNQRMISDLYKWLSLINVIDEKTLGWLRLSATYLQPDYEAIQFIEYLSLHVSKTPAEVGELYLEMLNSGVYPAYKKEKIQEIVRMLYDRGQRTIADRICNLYGGKGFDFLRFIYEEYRNGDNCL